MLPVRVWVISFTYQPASSEIHKNPQGLLHAAKITLSVSTHLAKSGRTHLLMEPKTYGDIFPPELLKIQVSLQPPNETTRRLALSTPARTAPEPRGWAGMGQALLRHRSAARGSRRGGQVNRGAVPSAISTPASAPPTPAGGEFGGSRPLPPASPQLQHQLQAAARAGLRLTHLPTGRGRRLLRSGRRGSGACISGNSGLCCSAPRRASSRVGGRRGGLGGERHTEE